MEMRQKQAIEAYRRVQEFVRTHPVQAPASYADGGRQLDEVVARLRGHSMVQAVGRRMGGAETVRQKALVRQLREMHLRPIAKIAKAKLSQEPGIEVALRIPRQTLPITRLVAEARAVSSAVTEYNPVFVANGRAEDFLEQLEAATDRLERSLTGRARKMGSKVGARVGIGTEIQRGREAVEIIDTVVTTCFANDPDVLAEWRSARRVQVVPGGSARASAAGDTEGALPVKAA